MGIDMLKLENGLEGVYDLTSVSDCRKVIQVLLRDVERANARVADTLVRLKGLALKVMSESADMKDAARNAIVNDTLNGSGVLGYIMRMVQEMKDVRVMSDDTLVSEILDKVWANYDISGRESAVIAELIERFRKTAVAG